MCVCMCVCVCVCVHVCVCSESCSVMSDYLRPHGRYSPWNYLGQNTGVGSLSLLQGIFPSQGLILGVPLCGWILYQLNHKESPRILEWVAYPFSRRYSQARNPPGVSCIAGKFLTNWAIREACVCSVTYLIFANRILTKFSESPFRIFHICYRINLRVT